MSLISRLTTWVTNQVLTSSALNSEFSNITNLINNLDAGTTTWDIVSTKNSTAVPFIADNGSGSTDIADFKANSVTKVSIGSTGKLTVSAGIVGTATNDSATAGNVGEYISSVIAQSGAQSVGTSGQFKTLTSIALTAGDWDISGQVFFGANGATVLRVDGAVSKNADNTTTDHVIGDNQIEAIGPTANYDSGVTIACYRMSLSGNQTVYLKGNANYSVATPNFYGRISARRVR